MNKVLKFLAERRFNLVDHATVSASVISLANGDMVSVVVILFIGCFVSVFVEKAAVK